MNFEKILEEMGGIGRAQIIFVIFAFWTQFTLCFNVYAQMFSQGDDIYRCHIPNCEESPANYHEDWIHSAVPMKFDEKSGKHILDNCQMYHYNETASANETCDLDAFDESRKVKCDRFVFASKYTTLKKQWNLTCDKRKLLTLSMSIFMSGFLVGVYVIGVLSDRFGRRKAIFISIVILISSNAVIIFSVNFYMYLVLRFFIAASGIGLMSTSYVLLTELIEARHRYLLSIASGGWQFSEFFLIALAYYVRYWKYFQIIVSCLSLPFLLLFWFCLESPKWLVSQKRYGDAKIEIKKFAKMQKKEVSESLLQIPQEDKDKKEDEQKKLTPLVLFRTPEVRYRMILISIIWCFDSLIAYAISLGAKEMPGSIYVNFSLLATGDFLGSISLVFAIKYFKRIYTMSAGMLAVGILSLGRLAVAPDAAMAIGGLAMVGRYVITITFNMTYVFTAELFPTPIRSSAMGTGSMFSRVGGIAAPFVASLIEVWRPLPLIILGSCGIIGSVVLLFLPETFNKVLPASIEEVEKSSSSRSIPVKLLHKCFPSHQDPSIVLKSISTKSKD